MNISSEQFGYNAFGLSKITDFKKTFLIKGLREKYLNPLIYYSQRKYYLQNE